MAVKDLDEEIQKQFSILPNSLLEYKIFSVNPDFDDKILARFQNHLPKPYVQIAYFVMTENCNLACSYCFIENKMDHAVVREKIMTKERAPKGMVPLFSITIQVME